MSRPSPPPTRYRGTAVGQALATRRAVVVEDYLQWGDPAGRHQLHATVGLRIRAVIGAPLLVDGAPIGVLRVHDTTPRAFVREDIALIQALADQAALALFRIAQEALANVIKHARAAEVRVGLAEAGCRIVLTVADNGIGFDTTAPAAASLNAGGGGMGLRSMRERAEAAGIELDVSSAPGMGTTVTASAARAAIPTSA